MILAVIATLSATPAATHSASLFAGDLDARPGAWAEYLITGPSGTARVRFSVLPAADGRHWLEMATVAGGTPPQAVRLLFRGASPRDAERMEIYLLGQAPLAIPVAAGLQVEKPSEAARRLREERVGTKAGSYAAVVLASGDAVVWRSATVPLWGVVKSRSPRETVELLGCGWTGATSVFPAETGPPR